MRIRDSFLLTALFGITGCPPSPSTTTDTGSTDTGSTDTGGTDSTASTGAPTTGGATDESTSGTTGAPTTGGATDESSSGTTDDSTTDATTTGADDFFPETCADIKAQQPDAADGEYTLYVGEAPEQPWTAYCHEMAADPREYLPLVKTEEGSNFSHYTAGGASPGTHVNTHFTRLRIDPITLVVDIDDFTFSESSGELKHAGDGVVMAMPYAVAESCTGKLDSEANVDLIGTPFKLKDPFCTAGFQPLGEAELFLNNQAARLTAGGSCGWSGPTKGGGCVDNPQGKNSGFALDLEYIGPIEQVCPVTCLHDVACDIWPDVETCMADCLGTKTGGHECDVAIAARIQCMGTQSCEDVKKSYFEMSYGECTDETMVEDRACGW